MKEITRFVFTQLVGEGLGGFITKVPVLTIHAAAPGEKLRGGTRLFHSFSATMNQTFPEIGRVEESRP